MSDADGKHDKDAFGDFLPPQPPPSVAPPGYTPPAPAYSQPPQHEPALQQPAGTLAPNWKPWMAFAALGAAFLGGGVLALIAMVAVTGGDFDAKNLSAPAAISSLVMQDLAFVAAAVGIAWIGTKPEPWHFGWRPVKKFWPAIGWTAVLYLSFIAFTAAFLAITGQEDQKDTLAEDLGADSSTAAAVAICVLIAVGAPLVEELLFRGFIFGSLRQSLPLWPAALITGVLFGSAHVFGSPIAFILPLAFLGTGLCLLYNRTGSLYPPMAVHAINNSVAGVSALDWDPALIPVVVGGSLAAIALVAWIVRSVTGPVPADAPSP